MPDPCSTSTWSWRLNANRVDEAIDTHPRARRRWYQIDGERISEVGQVNDSEAVLTLLGTFASRWRLQTDDLRAVRTALGQEIFDAFCRSFVQSDRLTSLAQLQLLNKEALPLESVASGRNTLTVLWLTVAKLREMAIVLRDLRSALAKRGWLDSDSEPVRRLRDFESRWEENALYRALRNTGAFHVDLPVIRAGVENLLSRPGPVQLAEGTGGTDHEMSLSIGSEALLLGLHDDPEVLRSALRAVHPDHKVYLALQELFVLALEKGDVALEQSEWPGPELP
jgi:hypothetical protein